MAKLIKFGYDSAGQLVYRNTGKLAPGNYEIRKGGVYKDGRRIGSIGQGTAKQKRKIASAEQTRRRTYLRQHPVNVSGKWRGAFKDIQKARQLAGNVLYKPKISQADIQSFAKGVKNMALYTAKVDQVTYQKIKRMDPQKLADLYNSDGKMVFEVYFDYGGVSKTSQGLVGSEQTAENARYLVSEYEKRYGVIA